MSRDSSAMGRWEALRARRPVVDAAIIGLVLVVLAAESIEAVDRPEPWTVALAVAAGLALLVRDRWPRSVLAVAIVARVVVTAVEGSSLAVLPVVAIALYTVARHGDRRSGVITASIGAAVMAVVIAALGDDGFGVELLEESAQAFLPIAVADAARTRAERLDDRIERESEARVQAERLRIARDLHDVVAHGLSAIAIQSGVAARLLDDDPAQARAALDAINQAGRTSLDELRGLVGALRSDELDLTHPIPADPDDLEDVLAPARAAGLDIEVHVDGSFPVTVGGAVVVAVHRILQESLMNVARHGGGSGAVVRVEHRVDEVRLTVTNGAASGARGSLPSTGVGIIGMRERAESVGGAVTASRTGDGGFEVVADIPYERTAR